MLKIGMIKKDFTPPAQITLCGQFRQRVSTHVESPICANVFAAEKDGVQLIIAACDLVGISDELLEHIRRFVQIKNPEIDTEKLIVCATHIHTGPYIATEELGLHAAAAYLPEDMRFEDETQPEPDVWQAEECIPYVAERIAEAICEAWEKREEALVAPGFGRAVVGHCRRTTYTDGSGRMYGATDTVGFDALEGGNDSGIELLYVFHKDEAKTPMGALVNIACPSQVVENQNYISADYWGKVRDRMEAAMGEGFVTVGLCSAAGDQSPRDQIRKGVDRRMDKNMQEPEGCIQIAERICPELLRELAEVQALATDDICLKNEVRPLRLPLRRVTGAEAADAEERIKREIECLRSEGKMILRARDMQKLHYEGGVLNRAKLQETRNFYDMELHVARIGDMAIATSPFELFLDFGNRIRARSKAAQTVLIQLSNGSAGYLPTAKAEKGGSYSAYVGSGNVGHEGGQLLVDATLEIITKLFERDM